MRTLLALLAFTTPALAQQPPCGPRDIIEKKINREYGETPIGAGITEGGTVYILNNPETGTFTILIRRPGGLTCLVMGGTGWANTDAIKPGADL